VEISHRATKRTNKTSRRPWFPLYGGYVTKIRVVYGRDSVLQDYKLSGCCVVNHLQYLQKQWETLHDIYIYL
jgi:hypothetical protein